MDRSIETDIIRQHFFFHKSSYFFYLDVRWSASYPVAPLLLILLVTAVNKKKIFSILLDPFAQPISIPQVPCSFLPCFVGPVQSTTNPTSILCSSSCVTVHSLLGGSIAAFQFVMHSLLIAFKRTYLLAFCHHTPITFNCWCSLPPLRKTSHHCCTEAYFKFLNF